MIRMLKNKLVYLGLCALWALTAWKSPKSIERVSTESQSVSSLVLTNPMLDSTRVSVAQLWVDSTLSSMTLDEKIGQFFVIGTYSNRYESYYATIDRLIKTYHVGGVIFFQGDPYSQAELSNRYQSLSRIPLIVSLDAENGGNWWGLVLLIKHQDSSHKSFPNLTLFVWCDSCCRHRR